jgi:hypothetical protein
VADARIAVRPTFEASNAGPSLSLYSGSRDFRDQLRVVAFAGPVDPPRHCRRSKIISAFSPRRSPASLSGSSSKSRLTCEHLQTPSEIFSDLDWQEQFDGALVRTGVGLDTNSDRPPSVPFASARDFLGGTRENPDILYRH